MNKSIALKPAQIEMMNALLERQRKAQNDIALAQKALAVEQENGNLFVGYCSLELGAGEGYVFEQASMAFVPRKEEATE